MKLMIQVEDHYHLLKQVKELHERVYVEESSPLKECRQRLNNIPTETLCAVACKLLMYMSMDYLHTSFHKDLRRTEKKTWRDLTLDNL